MNHEPNTIKWKVGDLVLHDGDRKDASMLMKVVKIQKNGIYVTQYIGEYKRWKNEVEYLHAPALFGVSAEETDIHKTDDGKVCCICKGHYPLPKGYVKGLCPVRNHHWLPDPDVFVCAECCVSLVIMLDGHSANAFYKEWDWEGTEADPTPRPSASGVPIIKENSTFPNPTRSTERSI